MERFGVFVIIIIPLLSLSHCLPTELNELHLPSAIRSSKPNTVCFTSIGCFSKNGTFGGILNLLPESPETIGAKFILFSKNNANVGQDIHYSMPETLMSNLFDNTEDTIFLVHGFAVTADPRQWFLKHAFLSHTNSQVIVVDWRNGVRPPAYWTGTANSEVVGRQIGVLIKELKEKRGLQPEKVHIVGSSLGAHVGGFAGKWVRDQYSFLLGRISGNDPAGPYFHDSKDSVHLSSKDAHFVDIIHTNGGRDILSGKSGLYKDIGHVDFYPNGGVLQPGCQSGHPTCSHMRADDLYADSLKYRDCRFKSFPCPGGFKAFQQGICKDCGEQGCGEMGFGAREQPGKGVQYLETKGEEPFCKVF